jgi:predicted amidohydrolase YtcJ
VIAYFNSVGITTAHSVGGSQVQGPGFFDPENDYEVIISLAQDDKVDIRLRVYFNALDDQVGNPRLIEVLDTRFPNFPEFGDIIRKMGVGEHLVSLTLETEVPLGQIYADGAALLAQSGLPLMEHSFDDEDHDARADVWGAVGANGLRWSVDHVNDIELATLDRLAAIGAAIRAHGAFSYLSASRNGPPFRRILEHGIRVGTGSDAAQVAPINPWLNLYYMTTGKDSTGMLINAGQQISREEALWLYTAANAWFSKEEDTLGSIEPGKLGDIVVLNANYFDSNEVSDEDLKRMHSVLTVLGGKVVHDTGELRTGKMK